MTTVKYNSTPNPEEDDGGNDWWRTTLTCPLCGWETEGDSNIRWVGGSPEISQSMAKSNYFDHLVASHSH